MSMIDKARKNEFTSKEGTHFLWVYSSQVKPLNCWDLPVLALRPTKTVGFQTSTVDHFLPTYGKIFKKRSFLVWKQFFLHWRVPKTPGMIISLTRKKSAMSSSTRKERKKQANSKRQSRETRRKGRNWNQEGGRSKAAEEHKKAKDSQKLLGANGDIWSFLLQILGNDIFPRLHTHCSLHQSTCKTWAAVLQSSSSVLSS